VVGASVGLLVGSLVGAAVGGFVGRFVGARVGVTCTQWPEKKKCRRRTCVRASAKTDTMVMTSDMNAKSASVHDVCSGGAAGTRTIRSDVFRTRLTKPKPKPKAR
jgi:hypothetical protein